jgi:hypothetical protein
LFSPKNVIELLRYDNQSIQYFLSLYNKVTNKHKLKKFKHNFYQQIYFQGKESKNQRTVNLKIKNSFLCSKHFSYQNFFQGGDRPVIHWAKKSNCERQKALWQKPIKKLKNVKFFWPVPTEMDKDYKHNFLDNNLIFLRQWYFFILSYIWNKIL